MGDGTYRGIWTDEHIVAYGDLCFVKDGYIEVAHEAVADMGVETDIASERGVDMRLAADVSEELSQYFLFALTL